MTPRRYSDAAAIWAGACNPSGIAHSIVNACREAREANADQKTDPAIQLMVAQLAYVTGVWDGVSDMKVDLIRVSAECDRLNAATKAASSDARAAHSDDPPVACANCCWTGKRADLHAIQHLGERVSAGEPMPAGECPKCGSLSHITGEG
jgi:hypothetical protein